MTFFSVYLPHFARSVVFNVAKLALSYQVLSACNHTLEPPKSLGYTGNVVE